MYPIALVAVGDSAPTNGTFEVRDCVFQNARRGVMALARGGGARSVYALVEGSVFAETGGNGAEAFEVDGTTVAATFRNNLFTGIAPSVTETAHTFFALGYVPDDRGAVLFAAPVDSNKSRMSLVSQNNRFERTVGVDINAGSWFDLNGRGLTTTENRTIFRSIDDRFVDNDVEALDLKSLPDDKFQRFTAALVVVGGIWGADGGDVWASLTRPTFSGNRFYGSDASVERSDLVVASAVDYTGLPEPRISDHNTALVLIQDAEVADGAQGTLRIVEEGLSQGVDNRAFMYRAP